MYRIGFKTTAVFGAVMIMAESAWLLPINPGSPYWYLAGIMIVIGFGQGCSLFIFTVTPSQ